LLVKNTNKGGREYLGVAMLGDFVTRAKTGAIKKVNG